MRKNINHHYWRHAHQNKNPARTFNTNKQWITSRNGCAPSAYRPRTVKTWKRVLSANISTNISFKSHACCFKIIKSKNAFTGRRFKRVLISLQHRGNAISVPAVAHYAAIMEVRGSRYARLGNAWITEKCLEHFRVNESNPVGTEQGVSL